MTRLLLALLLTAPGLALAQDSDDELDVDLLEGEEDEPSDDSERLDEADDIDFEWDESEADETELGDEHNSEDLLEGEGEGEGGADDAKVYQQAKEAVEGLPPDEEVIYWERYLEVYPNSTFKDRIDKRIATLMEEVYSESAPTRVGVTAGESTFAISQSLEGESIKPMQRLRFGFGWGLPDYLQLMVDYEHKLLDNLSVHGGMRNRYTGASLELGTHWAFVQSERTRTVVALLGDVRLNAGPAYLAVRPQLALGKKFGDSLDIQVQQGVELEARSVPGLRLIGLGNVSYRFNETVGAFVESSYEMKNLTWDGGGVFAFNVVSFGIKFYPSGGNVRSGQMEAMLGASAPAAQNYWGYHVGAIAGQGTYYFE